MTMTPYETGKNALIGKKSNYVIWLFETGENKVCHIWFAVISKLFRFKGWSIYFLMLTADKWVVPMPKNLAYQISKEHGRVHGYPSRAQVGRGRNWGHQIIWAEVRQKKTKKKTTKKVKCDQRIDQRTDGPTKWVVGSRSMRLKTKKKNTLN